MQNLKIDEIKDKAVVYISQPEGDLSVIKLDGKYQVYGQISDVGGMFWEHCGEARTLAQAMVVITECIKSNIEHDFYE